MYVTVFHMYHMYHKKHLVYMITVQKHTPNHTFKTYMLFGIYD